MVEGATLEKSCSERNLGFKSLTLRQKPAVFLSLREAAFFSGSLSIVGVRKS